MNKQLIREISCRHVPEYLKRANQAINAAPNKGEASLCIVRARLGRFHFRLVNVIRHNHVVVDVIALANPRLSEGKRGDNYGVIYFAVEWLDKGKQLRKKN